jgi:site-specific DNA-adenine methylase
MDRKIGACSGVSFSSVDFEVLDIPDGSLVYLDPPYRGTSSVGDGEGFDHDRFEAWANELSDRCIVVLSEYSPPDGWSEFWSSESGKGMVTCGGEVGQEYQDGEAVPP